MSGIYKICGFAQEKYVSQEYRTGLGYTRYVGLLKIYIYIYVYIYIYIYIRAQGSGFRVHGF